MPENTPILLAHRGLADYVPENTPSAFVASLALGFGLEIDLRLTADQQIVILHDPTVDRTTDGQGPVTELTLKQLKALDAGSFFDPSFSDQRVPSFEETLALVRDHARVEIPLLLDIKSTDSALKEETVRLLRQFDMIERAVLIGAIIRTPDLRRQYLDAEPESVNSVLANEADEWETAVAEPTSTWIYARFVPTADHVAAARQAGKRVLASGPVVMYQEPENWLAVRQAGVDAVLTDYPLECRRRWRSQP